MWPMTTLLLVSGIGCDPMMGEDGKLVAPIVVESGQFGVVGRAGTELVIQPDGTWIEERFWGTRKRIRLRSGQLKPEELRQIASRVDRSKFNDVPTEIGVSMVANPRFFRVSLGSTRRELLLDPRTDPDNYLDDVSAEQKVAASTLIMVFKDVTNIVDEAAGVQLPE